MTITYVPFQIVPEKVIRQSAKDMESEEGDNAFIYALELGKIFKSNELTPLYLLNGENMTIRVTSKQYVQKLFH